MSVADTIQELETDIGNAYDEVQTKGGTLPQNKNTNNLAQAIGTIPTGITPTGQIAITQNGTYDVTNYASASVAVAGFDIEITTEVFATATNNFNINNPREGIVPYGLIIRQTSVPEGTASRVIFVCMFHDLANYTIGCITGYNSNGSYVYNSVGNNRPGNYRDYGYINSTIAHLRNSTAAFIGTYEYQWLYEREIEGAEE